MSNLEICYLAFLFKTCSFVTNQAFVQQNTAAECFYVIASGQVEVYNKEKVETKKDYFKDDFVDDFEDESPYISPYQKNFLLKQPKEVNKYISLLEKGQVYLFNNSILVHMKYVNLFNINYHIDLEHKQVFNYYYYFRMLLY